MPSDVASDVVHPHPHVLNTTLYPRWLFMRAPFIALALYPWHSLGLFLKRPRAKGRNTGKTLSVHLRIYIINLLGVGQSICNVRSKMEKKTWDITSPRVPAPAAPTVARGGFLTPCERLVGGMQASWQDNCSVCRQLHHLPGRHLPRGVDASPRVSLRCHHL